MEQITVSTGTHLLWRKRKKSMELSWSILVLPHLNFWGFTYFKRNLKNVLKCKTFLRIPPRSLSPQDKGNWFIWTIQNELYSFRRALSVIFCCICQNLSVAADREKLILSPRLPDTGCHSWHFNISHCPALHCIQCPTLHCTALHSSALYYTTLHYTTLHYTALHYTTLHYTALHCTTLHCIALHSRALLCTALYCTALHCTAFHNTVLYGNSLQYTAMYCTPQHTTAAHCTVLQNTQMHYIVLL